ncbi:MAG: nitrate/nitrite transporter NrtS [Actinobacteria bacterium]|nr:nitrate/nitrite transporter NrtS [Actinomycetota bacterium]
MSRSRRTPVPLTWSRWPQAVALFARGATLRVAGPVSLIVGMVLTAVNQGSVLLGGASNWATWVRVAVNYATPFVVASVGYLGARRAPSDPQGEPPTAPR